MRVSAGARNRRALQGLVVAEIALAFALLAVSTVLIVHLLKLSNTPLGFETGQVLSFVLSLPGRIADDESARLPLQQRLIEAIQVIPGVEAAAFASHLPLKACCSDTWIFPEGLGADPGSSPRANIMAVSSGYFDVMRIPLRRGRFLADSDVIPNPPSIPVVLNQTAARRYWGGENPVGAHGRLYDPAAGLRFHVVGMAGDVKNNRLDSPTDPEIYVPAFYARVETMQFVVRSERSETSLMPDIRRAVRGVDPELPIHDVIPMRDAVRQTITLERAASFLIAFFAAAALLMAMLGIYGVVAYSVRQRTVEIGTRMALGATASEILFLMVRSGLTMAALGVLVGGAATLGALSFPRSVTASYFVDSRNNARSQTAPTAVRSRRI